MWFRHNSSGTKPARTSGLSPQQRQQNEDLRVVTYVLYGLFVIGIACTLLYGATIVALMLALACWITGGMIGFLFGVPKIDQTSAPAGSAAAALTTRQKVNTNIEKISDWLATIVVGITLVQLQALPHFIRHMASVLSPSAEPFGIALIVYFIALGVATGYLETRIYLSAVFSRADNAGNSTAISIMAANLMDEEYMALADKHVAFEDDSFAAPRQTITDPILKQATNKLAALSVDEMHTPRALELWATAMIGKGNFSEAMGALDRASKTGGTAEFYYEYAVAIYFATPNIDDENVIIPHTVHDALMEAYKRLPTCDDLSVHRSVFIGLAFYALYIQPPGGFGEAIKYCEQYLECYDKLLPSARIYFYLAAAYGQMASYHKTGAEYESARTHALAFSKRAVRTDPGTYLPLLQSLVSPSKHPRDNDLKIFANDAEFMLALGLPLATVKSDTSTLLTSSQNTPKNQMPNPVI